MGKIHEPKIKDIILVALYDYSQMPKRIKHPPCSGGHLKEIVENHLGFNVSQNYFYPVRDQLVRDNLITRDTRTHARYGITDEGIAYLRQKNLIEIPEAKPAPALSDGDAAEAPDNSVSVARVGTSGYAYGLNAMRKEIADRTKKVGEGPPGASR